MPSWSHVRFWIASALLFSGSVQAIPFPDEFVGPPSYSLMGCPYNEVWTDDVVKKATGLSDRVLERIQRKFGFSPARVCASDPQLVAGFVRSGQMKQNKADEPDKAEQQRTQTLLDDNGQIPNNAMQAALAQRQALMQPPGSKSLSTPTGDYLPLLAGISSSTTWDSLGPGNIGGRVRAISPDPATPNTILAGSVSGGVWKTVNGGSSWTMQDIPTVAVNCLVRDPTNPSIIFACTGEGVLAADSVRGLGIYKSTTDGVWVQIPTTDPATAGTDWFYVNRLAISPTNPNVMLAATNGGLYRTTNGTAQSPTWTKVYQQTGTTFRKVMDVQFHPTDGNIAVLGEGKYTNCSTSPCTVDGAAVAYSGDGGATWTRTRLNTSAISGTNGRTEIAFSKSSPNIVYAMVDIAAGQLYKSTDSGLTWTPNAPVSTPAHLGGIGYYANSLWVAPNDPNRIIAGGVTLRMSINGGSTWTQIGGTGGSIVHVDHHAIVSDPNYNSNFTIYNGNDGGVFKFTGVNTGTPSTTSPAFVSLNNGLSITQFYGLGAGPGGTRITGGTQDNGSLLYTGSDVWTIIWGNDGGNSAADSSDGNYVYGMTQYGGVVRYTTALSASPAPFAAQYICTGITDASCNFNNPSPKILFTPPLAIDKSNNTTMYLGAQQLWRSTNIKVATNTSVAWAVVKPANASLTNVSTITIAPGNSNLVWIGYEDGQLACTTNATAATPTWTAVSSSIARYVTRITFDPTNANRVIVAYGGYTSPNLRLTTSGCTTTPTWTSIHNTLPLAPIRTVEFNPGNPTWLYAGTEVGLFTSEDSGAHWSTTTGGPGATSIEEFAWIDASTLLLATHGRGVWRAHLASNGAPAFTNAPPPNGTANVAYNFTFTATGTPAPTFSVTAGGLPTGLSLNGTTGVLSGTPTSAAAYTGTITATNSAGTATQNFSITIASGLPGSPTVTSNTPGNGQATIAFVPGPSGSSPITGFTAICNPGAFSASGAASPLTVTGLSNGTTYSCAVTATNNAGTGPSSTPASNVTPASGVAFTSAPPPAGTFGVAYTFTYTASGAPGPTFSLTSGAFPGGLTLNGTSGVLSGTPNAAGTFTGVVTATSSAGTATQSFSITIAATVPGAPTIGTGTPGNGQATIAFTAPASNGGSAITSFTATCNPGALTASGAASPLTVTGLTNGTAYSCSVKANNAVGASASSGTVSVTPGVAPAITSAAPPASGTFGVAYAHTYTATGSPAPTFSVTSGALPGGLSLNGSTGAVSGTPNAAGTFTGVVTATNAVGTATQSFSITIAATVPSAPTIGAATPGNGQATIAFTASSSNGGSAITSYTATCTPGPFSASGAGSPLTVTGLANGTLYSCSVKANNAIGASAASGSVSVTPGVAPAFTSAAPAGGTFNVAYSHTYAASGSPAPTFSLTSGAFPGGLALNGTTGALTGTPNAAGTFTGVVTATNTSGSVTQSFSITIAATVPGAPTIGAGVPGPALATISFTPPASNGGSAITSYTATCTPGPFSASAAASPINVTGLANGTTYSCSVKATNAIGTSAASGTVSVTPAAGPAFTNAPPPNGSFNVPYSFTYTANGSPAPTFSLTSGAFPTGLTLNGTTGALTGTPNATGTFTGVVTAANSGGTVTQSFSITIAPTVPGAPTIGTATPGNGLATISFTPPASNGGSAITSFVATCNPGAVTTPNATSPINVGPLTNGTTYTCSVQAVNSVGASAPSATVSVTPGVGPAITSGAPPAGTFGAAYSHTYTASGSPAPTFSLTSGAFPGGLSLNGSTGALTGTPNAVGTFTGVVTATNSSGSTTQAFSITIGPALPGAPTIGSATPGDGQATIAFTAPASNGGSAITSFTATCLPGPFSASGAGSPITVTGLANGTSYSCSVTATNGVGTGPASGSVSVTAGVVPAFTSGPPPAGTFNVAYSHTFTASGAPAPTFSLASGTLPGGLALAPSGAVTGTPTTAGTFSGVVTATNAAGSATQSFSITIAGTVPGAPTIGSATAGNAIATISFTPPASNGGSPITGYTASCTPGPKTGSNTASPITVTGLTNGTTYTCSVKATNAIGTSASSGTVTVTPLSGIVLALVNVVSRKVHPGWGAFDLPVNSQAIGSAITVEPRMIGAGHKLVFSFNDAVFSVGSVACVDASSNPVGTATAVIVGNTVEVTLTGVPDRMRVSVSLGGLNGTLNASRAVGFLVGDVDNSYTVDSKDILKIKGSSKSAPITSQNFIYDVDVSGGVSLSDQNAAKVNTGISI